MGHFREIWLNNDMPTVVDELDWFRLAPGPKWCAQVNDGGVVYAYRKIIDPQSGKRVKQFMHRVIANARRGVVVDHRDGDGLHNWRRNLKSTDYCQNAHNYIRVKAEGYRGVQWRPTGWQAKINEERKRIYIGTYDLAKDAALAYDREARRIYGPDAILNFPEIA